MTEVPVLISNHEDVYVTECPITSVSTFGDTEKEALENHKEAMELYVEEMPEPEIQELFPSGVSPVNVNTVRISSSKVKA